MEITKHKNGNSPPDTYRFMPPAEVPVSKIPGKRRVQQPSKYDALYADIQRRLEMTERNHALRYDFEHYEEARKMNTTIQRWMTRRYGEQYVAITLRSNRLYIMRGDRWYKP